MWSAFTCVDEDMRGEEMDLLISVHGKDNEDVTGLTYSYLPQT